MDPIVVLNQAGGFVGVSALVAGLFWMLSTGRLCTGRELKEKNDRIDKLFEIIDTRDKQLSMVLEETLPTVSTFMATLRQAAEGQEQ